MSYAHFLLFGALGGFARGMFGAYKNSLKIGNGKKVEMGKLLLNIGAATIIGAVVGLIVDHNPITACTAGYAGIDIIETVVKLKK